MNVNCEELISKVKEFGGLMEKIKKSVDDFQKQLEDFKSDADKPHYKKANYGDQYYTVDQIQRTFCVGCHIETSKLEDLASYINNNYFYSENRAKKVVGKIKFLLRLERLHDELCPDFVPILNPVDMKDGQTYYTIYFNSVYKSYSYFAIQRDYLGCAGYPVCVFFPKKEIAQEACYILNEDLRQTNRTYT